MPAPYINTPRTNDASYLSNGYDRINELSPEKSFAAPGENGDLISQMKKARGNGMNLKTPRVNGRDPLRLLPNGNQPQGKPEFTPLLQSVARTNISRRLAARKSGGIETPAYLRNSYLGGATPALPRMEEESNIHSEHTGSSLGRNNDYTPMLQNMNSSAQSTPLAQLPGRDAVVNDGNMMTLREQENIIDKIEKENFGLKMKIHFLEEAIAKRGGDFNQAALKENTDLKVNRITMQKELHKFKKTLAQAERDADVYRHQLEEYRERVRRKQMDESIRIEVDNVRSEMKSKEAELEELRSKYESVKVKSTSEVDRLRGDLEDLHAELRDKDRQLEAREDEIDLMKLSSKKESNVATELEEELESARQQIQEMKDDLERAERQAQEAKEEQDDALDEKRRAEQELDELRDEIANKSFTEKGLSRRMDERVERLREENNELQDRYASIQSQLDEKTRSEKKLQEQLYDAQKEGTSEARHFQQELEEVEQQRETLERKYNNSQKQMESLERDLQEKRDEKDLLQTRHDALTTESAELQKELNKARKSIKDLEDNLVEERRRAAQNDDFLRSQHKTELDMLNEQIDQLHKDLNSKETEFAADRDEWDMQRRNLESSTKRAEEKALGLQRTVDKLNDVQGTLSGSEIRLQEALGSEKQRHLEEEKVLKTQIQELNEDLNTKRVASDTNRTELNNAKEELRISIREQAALKEKVVELEDEIEVLQADIEQEHEYIQQLQSKSGQVADAQVTKLRKEKQELYESLATLNAELQKAKQTIQSAEAEREDLEVKLEKAQKPHDDTFDVQQEKRELRRVKQTIEKDLEKIRAEKDSLAAANDALEAEINAEIDRANAEENRLNAEIAQLKTKYLTSSESRDRELTSAKNKASRLENRITELENLLDNQSRKIGSPGADVSGLRHDLAEARKMETAATKRETDFKAANRDLKMQLNDLEKELHEARLAQLKSRSPSASPVPSQLKEVAQLRQELVEARASAKDLQSENRDLKRAAHRSSAKETSRIDLEDLLKSTSKEAESLAAKVADRDDELSEMKIHLQRIRQERNEARNNSFLLAQNTSHAAQVAELKLQVKRLRAEREEAKDISVRLSVRDKEASELKQELRRLREDRTRANQKAEDVEKELDAMQLRYESILERLSGAGRYESSGKDETQAKELKGLMREITYLKAKCRREERLRTDLAWSKNYLEQGEAMRVQCNQIDLRILREMGIDTERQRARFDKPLTPKQRLRAGIFVIMAAVRMSKLEESWREKKALGESLRKARIRQATR